MNGIEQANEIVLGTQQDRIISKNPQTESSYHIKDILEQIASNYPILIEHKKANNNDEFIIKVPLTIKSLNIQANIIFGTLGGMLKTTFKQKVVLQCRDFMQDVSFQECVFENDLSIMGCNFHKNALFDNAKINGFFVASKSVFHKQASFWNVDFKKIPNFSGVGFTESNLVNFVNAKVDNSFEKLSQLVKNETKGKDNDTSNQIRNDIRDSYRTIKNTLIQQNNLLDTSQWHKLELYAKEIELDSKEYKEIKNNNEDFRDCVDKWILKFYRHTSDHHTDFLKIWHNLLIVVGIFGILSGGVIVAFDYGYLKFCDFSAHSLIEMYNAHINHFVLTHSYQMLGMNALLFMLFIGLFILSVLWDRARVIGICISYCVMIFLFAASPKYLIPAIGIFTDKRSMLDPLSVIGGIYTIVFAFMLYSFIKTARKNSIVPH